MLIREKNGSLTINVNEGEITMSTRNVGMVGKTYKSASEAFKDATWSTAITRPEKTEYHYVLSYLAVFLALGFTVYILNYFFPY
jgi:hypothetical protein